MITDEGVKKLLSNLKTSKAAGSDNFHPRVLKEAARAIAPMVKQLFQKSLVTGTIPWDWRIANVRPIYKKGDRSLASNYRPVSLTCVNCKILEYIVCSHINQHLETYGILSDRQHAFREKRSCVTQLCFVIDDWASALDPRLQTDAFVLDFAKAFDSVPHGRLKAKLNCY